MTEDIHTKIHTLTKTLTLYESEVYPGDESGDGAAWVSVEVTEYEPGEWEFKIDLPAYVDRNIAQALFAILGRALQGGAEEE